MKPAEAEPVAHVKPPPPRPQSAHPPPTTLQEHLILAFQEADPEQRGFMPRDKLLSLLIQICGSVLGDQECRQLLEGFIRDYQVSDHAELNTQDFISWLCPKKPR